MATCKDCIHNSVCSLWRAEEGQDAKFYAETLGGGCALFANKSRFIEAPCEIGTHLWRVTHIYRQPHKVTEFVVKNFRTAGKKHALQIEVQVVNVSGTNWTRYTDFYITREEAEAELQKRTHKPLFAPDNSERCVCCGDVILEGRQVCPKCEKGT